jgi:hypothetical protein
MSLSAPKSVWFRKAEIWIPTWRSWAGFSILLAVLLFGFFRYANRFLSPTMPVTANVLIVEGWVPDYVLKQAIEEFRNGHYEWLVTTGEAIELGSFLSPYRNYAELAGATLRKMGVPSSVLIEAPARMTAVNRSFESARSARDKLSRLKIQIHGINVLSEGAHARRTHIVYHKVFGPDVRVGIIAAPDRTYDPRQWWKSSNGLSATITQGLKWIFEVVLSSGR